MKNLMRFVAGAVLALGVLGAGCKLHAAEPQSAKPDADPLHYGFIRFSENSDGGGKNCGIPIKNGKYNLRDNAYNCTEDDYSYFMFDGAPSVVNIRLTSDFTNNNFDCGWDGGGKNDWAFNFSTIKNPTTTGWISIASLRGHHEGDIIKAGVRMGSSRYESGDIEAELECVSVNVSPLP